MLCMLMGWSPCPSLLAGTGKTFIGYKLLRMLVGKSRILVLTYKNDALDGFLEPCRRAPHSLRAKVHKHLSCCVHMHVGPKSLACVVHT